jgi:histidine ammonia-lyase
VESAIEVLRDHVPPLADDRILAEDFAQVLELMRTQLLLIAAESVAGPIGGLLR